MGKELLKKIIVMLLLFSLFSGFSAVNAQENQTPPPEKPVKSEEPITAERIMREVWKSNSMLPRYQGDISIVRISEDFLWEVFPDMDDPRFTTLEGVINYTKTPRGFRLMLVDTENEDFLYNFTSTDGYYFVLDEKHTSVLDKKKLGLRELSREKRLNPADSNALKYSRASDFSAEGGASFEQQNPLNLLFPFSLKQTDPSQKLTYMGKRSALNTDCHLIEISSSLYGRTQLYVSDDDKYNIIQIDRLDSEGAVYASATYGEYREFLHGGRVFGECQISVLDGQVLTATITNYRSKHADIITPVSPVAVVRPTPTPRKPRQGSDIPIGVQLLTAGTAALVIVLLVVLVFFIYRYWFYKAERIAFAREIIIVEGDRAEDKVSHLFADQGVISTPFTAEKLTKEREILNSGTDQKPKMLVVGPGMFSKIKSYNFLIKGYVADGGRVLIFEHGVDSSKDLPFTPTFLPYDRKDENFVYIPIPKWQKLWRQTSQDELLNRTNAFLPNELLARLKEKNLEIDPIVVVNNPNTNITAAAISLVYDGKGEYLLVQYRLLEAIRKLKFTSNVAEKMLADLMTHMFGKEKSIEIAPKWLLDLLGMGKPRKNKK